MVDYQLPSPNKEGDVGIAVGFSSQISIEQLPASLQGHTTLLQANNGEDRNLYRIKKTFNEFQKQLET